MSSSLYLGSFEGGNCGCTLFTYLAYAFFRDQEDPHATNPPEIILISPMEALLPLSLAYFPSCPSIVFYTALFFIQTSVTFPDGLMFLLGPSDICICQCYICQCNAVVLVESAILAFISYFCQSVNGFRPLQRRFVPYLHQYLLNRYHQRSKTGKLGSLIQRVLPFIQRMPNTVRISALKSYCMVLCMLLCMTLCMT